MSCVHIAYTIYMVSALKKAAVDMMGKRDNVIAVVYFIY
jgi:hypothetical protein